MDDFANPLRVVVASTDARFLKLTGFMLPRRGLLVHAARRPTTVERDVERHCADVLVLDGGRHPGAADATAARLQAARPTLGVVVVAEDGLAGGVRGRLAKWGVHDLVREIRAAQGRSVGAGQPLLVDREVPVHT